MQIITYDNPILHSYIVHVQTQKPENPSGGPLGTTFLKEICDI